MKAFLIIFFSFLIGLPVFSQDTGKWTAFWDAETELMGFKNANGKVEIEPKFMGFTIAREFENIVAVMEDQNGQYEAYYLTKSGKKVGYDSLHIYDNGADCESEGFIRFRDKKTDKVGMFDIDGNIAIPAIYNELSRVHNGLILALKDAEKKYWKEHNELGCNHYQWTGGFELLLDTGNQTIIEDFQYEGELNFYSMNVQNQPSADLTKVNFKGVNGKYYIFTDLEKEFIHWLDELSIDLTFQQLESFTMDSVTYWEESNGWVTESKNDFLSRNFELIKERLLIKNAANSDSFVSIDGLNPFMYRSSQYDQYFNNCGQAIAEKYPVMDLIINNQTGSELIQDHIEFLKTAEGYRLINVTIRNGEIK